MRSICLVEIINIEVSNQLREGINFCNEKKRADREPRRVGEVAAGKLGGTRCASADGLQRGEPDALSRGRVVEAKRCTEAVEVATFERRPIQRERICIGTIARLELSAAAARGVAYGDFAGAPYKGLS
jgi:hypothetical protein